MINLFAVLFRKHKKHLPPFLRHRFLKDFLSFGFSVFISAWIFQGMLYMDKREALLKIFLDIIMLFLLVLVGISLVNSFLIAHTLNFAFNGQLFAMYTHMGATKVEPNNFLNFIIALNKRLYKCDFVECAAGFGSLSRGIYKSTSDLDIRICPRNGCINWIKATLWAAMERSRAFIYGFPLDLYVFDLKTVKRKMKTDEPPIVFISHSNLLEQAYGNLIQFNDFIELFKENNCRL